MVRNYKAKTQRGSLDEKVMNKAVSDVLRGVETPTSAGRKYNIKRQTIESRIKKRDPLEDLSSDETPNEIIYQSKFTCKQVFTEKKENELVEYIKKCVLYQFGLTYKAFRRLAYEYAKANGKACPEKWDVVKEAGEDWLYGFMKRNPTLTLRKPERTSLARLTGFTKKAVDEFYDNLKALYGTHSFQPKDIYNLDETGITTVVDTPKVIAVKGQRQVGQAVSAERGSLVTLVGIINASGNRLPPVYVFPRQRYKSEFLNGCVPGSLGLVSKSGWMMSELFIHVLKHIQANTNCSKERPILILLDNHSSHCSIDSINFSRETGIHMLSFTPHTSHRLQPLDVAVYGPFKKFLQTSFNDFMTNNAGKRITIYEVARLSNLPLQRSFSPENIISGFSSTGIYPLNSQNFNEVEFAAEEQPIVNTVEPENDDCAPITPVPSSLTPEQLRPVSRLNASRKTTKSGSSRILTSSIEKRKIEEKQCEKNAQLLKKVRKNLMASKTEIAQIAACKKKNNRSGGRKHGSRTRMPKVVVRENISSSEESNTSVSYADTDQSVGSFFENEDASENNDASNYKLTESTELKVGDYVLVNLGQNSKKLIYYIAEITETLGDCTFTVSFFRKLDQFSSLFVKPENEDISVVLRSEIELKLPSPSNLPSTSRSRTKYLFEVDLKSYYIK